MCVYRLSTAKAISTPYNGPIESQKLNKYIYTGRKIVFYYVYTHNRKMFNTAWLQDPLRGAINTEPIKSRIHVT